MISIDVLLSQLVGALLLPPGVFVLAGVAAGWLIPRRPRVARGVLAASAVLLWLLATPWCAGHLHRWLEVSQPITRAQLQAVDAVVVLGGGKRRIAPEYGGETLSSDTLVRLRYGVRLARSGGKPLLLTGGAPLGGVAEARLMADAAREEFGITPRWVETESNTTLENARLSAVLLRRDGVARIALVSDAWHLPRAVRQFSAAGLTVTPAPTDFVAFDETGALAWLPKSRALRDSSTALRELLGMAWYRWRGRV